MKIDLQITGGTITIKKNGSDYDITFDCSAVNNKNAKGSFKGLLSVYNPYYPHVMQ